MQGKQELVCPKPGLWGQQAEMAAGAGAGQDQERSEGSLGVLFILFSNQEAALFQHCVRVDGLLCTKSMLKSQGGEAGRKMTPLIRAQAAAGGQQHPPGGWQRVGKQKHIKTSFTAKKNPRLPRQSPQPHLTSSLRLRADAAIPLSPRTAPCTPHKLLVCCPRDYPDPRFCHCWPQPPSPGAGSSPSLPWQPSLYLPASVSPSPSRTLGDERFFKPLWEAFLWVHVFQQGRFLRRYDSLLGTGAICEDVGEKNSTGKKRIGSESPNPNLNFPPFVMSGFVPNWSCRVQVSALCGSPLPIPPGMSPPAVPWGGSLRPPHTHTHTFISLCSCSISP